MGDYIIRKAPPPQPRPPQIPPITISPRNNMTTTQKATGKLFSLNQWLMPLLTLFVGPFVFWAFTHIRDLEDKSNGHASLVDVLKLRAEIDLVIAGLPPTEWKERIVKLEESDVLTTVSMTKIEAMLIDIRERVIRLDEQHRANPKKPTP